MSKVSDRLEKLSPSQRKLLERLLAKGEGATGEGAAAPSDVAAPLSFGSAFDAGATSDTVKDGYRDFYNGVSEQLDSSAFGQFSYFLNYGYVPDLTPSYSRVAIPDHFFNKSSVRLVLEVVGDYDMDGKRVLDVGCGRGGTAYVLQHFCKPASVNAIDLSPKAIDFCRRAHKYPNVRFDEGDAENLPFPDGSMDAVTNIESSHTYPHIDRFYSEVARVLADGGCFLYTDMIPVEELQTRLDLLGRAGLAVELKRDITNNVLLSCDEVADSRVSAFAAGNDPTLMQNFLAVPGSHVYDSMRDRRWQYLVFKIRKTS